MTTSVSIKQVCNHAFVWPIAFDNVHKHKNDAPGKPSSPRNVLSSLIFPLMERNKASFCDCYQAAIHGAYRIGTTERHNHSKKSSFIAAMLQFPSFVQNTLLYGVRVIASFAATLLILISYSQNGVYLKPTLGWLVGSCQTLIVEPFRDVALFFKYLAGTFCHSIANAKPPKWMKNTLVPIVYVVKPPAPPMISSPLRNNDDADSRPVIVQTTVVSTSAVETIAVTSQESGTSPLSRTTRH